MRISTAWNHQLGVNAMLQQQAKLSDTQLKLSSGKKYLSPAENPTVASNLIDLQQNIAEHEQYQVNINAARQRLELQESVLANANDTVQRIRELTVQALNDSNNAENRKQIGFEIDELNKHLLGLANTQNANGEYLFAGLRSDQPAFRRDDSDVLPAYFYEGTEESRQIAIGPNRWVTDGNPGSEVFGVMAGGLTLPAAGDHTNVFEAISRLSESLKTNTPLPASLQDLDDALVRFETTRSATGARLHALDHQENVNADFILDHQVTVSELGDLDYAEALSRFNLQQTSLQAAQQAFTRVQNLSLFNYL